MNMAVLAQLLEPGFSQSLFQQVQLFQALYHTSLASPNTKFRNFLFIQQYAVPKPCQGLLGSRSEVGHRIFNAYDFVCDQV